MLVMMNASRGLMFDAIHPLREFSELPDLRVIPGGTSVNSPRYGRLLGALGLSGGRALLAWLIDNPRVLLALDAAGEMDADRWEALWLSYYNRHVAPGTRLRLLPAIDYRNDEGYGLVFYHLRRVGDSGLPVGGGDPRQAPGGP